MSAGNGLPNGETGGAKIHTEGQSTKSAEVKATEAQMKKAVAEVKAQQNQAAAAELTNAAGGMPPTKPEEGLRKFANNTFGLFGQPTHIETGKPGLGGVLPQAEQPAGPVAELPSTQQATTPAEQSVENPDQPASALPEEPAAETPEGNSQQPVEASAVQPASPEPPIPPEPPTPNETTQQNPDESSIGATPPPSEGQEAVNPEDQQKAARDAFVQEQLHADERLQNLLKNNDPAYAADKGMSADAMKAEMEKIAALGDKASTEQVKLYYGLQEMLDLAEGNEGQKELDALRASGEDLTTPEGKAKEDAALRKIAKGQSAEKVRTMREQIAQDSVLQRLLREHGIDPDIATTSGIDKLRDQLQEMKKNNKTLSREQQKILQKLNDISGVANRDVAYQDIANIDKNDPQAAEKLQLAVARLAATHETDKGWLGNFRDKWGSRLSKFSTAELKEERRQWVSYGKTLKELNEKLKKEERPKQQDDLKKSINALKSMRHEKIRKWAGKMALKWFVILFLGGPPALALLTSLGAAQALKMSGKAQG